MFCLSFFQSTLQESPRPQVRGKSLALAVLLASFAGVHPALAQEEAAGAASSAPPSAPATSAASSTGAAPASGGAASGAAPSAAPAAGGQQASAGASVNQAGAEESGASDSTAELQERRASVASTHPEYPSPSTPVTLNATYRQVRRLISLGELSDAVKAVEAALAGCDSPSSECPAELQAALYVELGAIYAETKGGEAQGLRAFRFAFALDENAELEEVFATERTVKLYEEAKGAATQGGTMQTEQENPERGNILLLVQANAQAGIATAINAAGSNAGGAESTGQLGMNLTLAGSPGAGRFLMGARGRGGSYVSRYGAVGYGAMDAMLGVLLGPRKPSQFSYIMAGPGIEYIPAAQFQEMLIGAHVAGGVVAKGFNFGAGMDFAFSESFNYFMMGIQVGWGHLF